MNNSDLTPDQVARLEADGQSPEKVRGERVEIEKMYDSLIGKLVSYHPEADVALIRRTFEYAYDKHLLQRRKSGEPYIIHPLGVAKLVSQLKLDEASICAALLHDVVEDTDTTRHDIVEAFGTEIADLVDALTKLDKYSFTSKEERQETQKMELSKDNEALLAKGRSNLAQLRAMSARIRSAAIRGKANGICASADQILRALRDDPGDIPRVRTFFNYYLPTLGTLLTKYEYLERSRAPLEEMTVKFSDCLDQIQSAMDRQYANLFEDDLLDMTAEMQTMTAVCRRDGLLTDGSVETDGGIRLTL